MKMIELRFSATPLRRMRNAAACIAVAMLAACAAPQPRDYTAYKQSRPASVLILPPINEAPEVNAGYGVLAQATQPLAEAGYYVLPVSLVDETFRGNGLTAPSDVQQVPVAKLREIFGADAALYLKVTKYGTSYMIISSETLVAVEGKLLDLRTGALLWQGQARASSSEGDSSQGGLAGLLVKALVAQIAGSASDAGYRYAAIADQRLLGAGRANGVLYGPRSPNYLKD